MHGQLCPGPADRQMVLGLLLPRVRNRTRHANGASTDTTAAYCFTFAFPGYNNIGCSEISGSEKVEWTYDGQTDSVATGPTLIQTAVMQQTTATHRPDPTSASPFERPSPTPSGSGRPDTNVAAIAGGAVGGCAILAIFVLGMVWLLRRNKKNELDSSAGGVAYVGMQYEQRPPVFSGQPPPPPPPQLHHV